MFCFEQNLRLKKHMQVNKALRRKSKRKKDGWEWLISGEHYCIIYNFIRVCTCVLKYAWKHSCLCSPEEGVVSRGAGVTGNELPNMGPGNSALHY